MIQTSCLATFATPTLRPKMSSVYGHLQPHLQQLRRQQTNNGMPWHSTFTLDRTWIGITLLVEPQSVARFLPLFLPWTIRKLCVAEAVSTTPEPVRPLGIPQSNLKSWLMVLMPGCCFQKDVRSKCEKCFFSWLCEVFSCSMHTFTLIKKQFIF